MRNATCAGTQTSIEWGSKYHGIFSTTLKVIHHFTFTQKKQFSKNTSWASSPMTSISRANSTLKLLAFGGLKTNDQMLHGIGIFTYIHHKFKPHVGKPRTQMTLVLIRKGLVLEGWSPKIEDEQVPGKYTSPMEHIWVMIRVCEVHIPLCWTPQKQWMKPLFLGIY